MNAAPHSSPATTSTSAFAGYPTRNDYPKWAVLRLTWGFEAATVAGYSAPPFPESTTAGFVSEPTAPIQTTGEAILEIRRRSGLTWDELADLFAVSRRSVHHWANGNPPSARHEIHIRRTLAALCHVDEGSQMATRDRLLTIGRTGHSTFDLLANGRFGDVFGQPAGSVLPERRRVPLSRHAQEVRRPTPPALLLGADQGRPRIPVSKARVVRAARVPKKNPR